MLLAATGIEFTEEEALEELRGGGWVWVAPEGSGLTMLLKDDVLGGGNWQDTMALAGQVGDDVAYVNTEEDGKLWSVTEAHATATFETPEEALSAAQYGDLRQWLMVRALKEGP